MRFTQVNARRSVNLRSVRAIVQGSAAALRYRTPTPAISCCRCIHFQAVETLSRSERLAFHCKS